MSAIDSALSAVGSITTTIGVASNTMTRVGADLTGGLKTPGAAGWVAQLRPASFRGVPFGVLASTGKFGRRNAVHEYPFRDTVWVEDLGRGPRRISVSGFMVGDDVIAQRERMIAATETAGPGELIHPSLGRLKVSTMDFSAEEQWDRGRVIQLTFSFIEAGERVFPGVAPTTGAAVKDACKTADAAASADFVSKVGASLKQGAAVAAKAASTAAAWGRQAQRLANDATNLYNMVGTMKGSLGRYAGGGAIGKFAAVTGTLAAAGGTIPKLIALGSVARTSVTSAIAKLTAAGAGMGS